jgi:hypothetical protein
MEEPETLFNAEYQGRDLRDLRTNHNHLKLKFFVGLDQCCSNFLRRHPDSANSFGSRHQKSKMKTAVK